VILGALEIVYVTLRRMQFDLVDGSPRHSPFVLVWALLIPVINAILVLLLPATWAFSARLGDSYPTKNLSLAFLASCAIAALLVALILDRRRLVLDKTYSWLPGMRGLREQVIGFIAWLTALICLAFLSKRFPAYCLLLFVFSCLSLRLTVHRRA